MEKAVRELHELACKQRKEGIHEDIQFTNILVPVLELVQLPTANPQVLKKFLMKIYVLEQYKYDSRTPISFNEYY